MDVKFELGTLYPNLGVYIGLSTTYTNYGTILISHTFNSGKRDRDRAAILNEIKISEQSNPNWSKSI